MENNQENKILCQRIFCVISVSRMVDGEFTFVKTEQAFKNPEDAKVLMEKLKKQFIDPTGAIVPIVLNTPHGDVVCHCEVGVFEVELHD